MHILASVSYIASAHTHLPSNVVSLSGERESVNPELRGTKAAALYRIVVKAGDTAVVRCRLFATGPQSPSPPWFGQPFDDLISERISDTDTFYSRVGAAFTLTQLLHLSSSTT